VQAAPPPNDSIASATTVSTIPSTFVQDTRRATAAAGDGECVAGRSIWYRYRPASTGRARVVTAGSDYDTLVAVFRGPRSQRTLVACNDDAIDLASATRVRFVAGQTYWIAVSACCNRRAPGGQSVLTLYRKRAAGVSVTVDGVESGGVSGRLFVSGTIRCNTPSLGLVDILATQRVGGGGVARGSAFTGANGCTDATTAWRTPLDSDTGWAFQPGEVALTLRSFSLDGFVEVSTEETLTAEVVDNPDARHSRRP
jgi:hypothetical protein